MIIQNFKGYREGQDILTIPPNYLAYPSKNCLTYKGKIITRLGIKNDGTAHTENTKVHSEFVWKKAPGGAKALRVWGTTLQVKWNGKWITLYAGFSADTTRVRFTSWIDTNGAIIKSRLYMVDGSDAVYEWNGAIGTIAAIQGGDAGGLVRISDTKTLLQLGFDPGDTTPQNVQIVSLDANGVPDDYTEYTHEDALSSNDSLTLGSTPSPVQAAGDLLMASVVKHTDILTGIEKDDVYSSKNQLYVASLESGRIYYSDAIEPLDFTVPVTTTAVTAGLLDLDGNYTAMIERKGILWISTVDDWYKITKAIEENAYGFWTTVEKFEAAESIGAKPFAVAIQKGDVVFMAQDKRLRRIITLEVLGIDDIELISDQIDGLLDRLELEDIRIYYHQRYVFVISAGEGVTLMLDIIEGEYMPPQEIGMSCMSIIDGLRYGHSNSRNETFELFSGRNDLDGQIASTIAFGFTHGSDKQNFTPKKHDKFGIHGRGTVTAVCDMEYQYEEFGAEHLKPAQFKVKNIKTYDVSTDVSFGANPFASHSFAGVDDVPENPLKGFFLFDQQEMVSWFDFRPVLNITGSDAEFQVLAWMINEEDSDDLLDPDLFINRE
ncbi:hypothetical protein A2Z56_02380 [Candidatus Kaiserbacteria bacterium RIFCSPHIGHO2_12_45_16]|nr:MAG: hypothetical protein A2Z56_02380 [Candidatus Kaiserbacteria bacterium RIFCSPHIGHO2_12_45_16]